MSKNDFYQSASTLVTLNGYEYVRDAKERLIADVEAIKLRCKIAKYELMNIKREILINKVEILNLSLKYIDEQIAHVYEALNEESQMEIDFSNEDSDSMTVEEIATARVSGESPTSSDTEV